MNNKKKTIRKRLKEWWLSRYQVIHIGVGVAFSHLYVYLVILDYGIKFRIELPYVLDKLNSINWITKSILNLVLKWCGFSRGYLFWRLGEWKSIEVQIIHSCKILSFDYIWKVHADHWGHEVECVVAGINLRAEFADGRHWDYDKDSPEM